MCMGTITSQISSVYGWKFFGKEICTNCFTFSSFHDDLCSKNEPTESKKNAPRRNGEGRLCTRAGMEGVAIVWVDLYSALVRAHNSCMNHTWKCFHKVGYFS